MNKIKLKAITLLICSSAAGYSIADETLNNKMPTTETPQTVTMQVTQPSDATLTGDVNAMLADYSGKVAVRVKNGIVYLSGELPSDTDYEKAITIAESTKGVVDVNADNLSVKESQAPLYDTYLTAKVKGSLIQADVMGKDIPSWTVAVETKNGQVFLSGTVASEEEKHKIGSITKKVNGVNSVDNQIVVGNVTPENGQSDETTVIDNSTQTTNDDVNMTTN